MKTDLDIIGNFLEIQYTPLQWKEKYFGWNLKDEIAKSKKKIDQQEDISNKEFHAIVHDFFKSLHDCHTTVQFCTTKAAALPFSVKGSNNRYFISHLDKHLSQTLYPLHIGDEIASFNGKSTHEVILQLQSQEFGTSEEGTVETKMFLLPVRMVCKRCC